MKVSTMLAATLTGAMLSLPLTAVAVEPDADASHPAQFVKDSAITTAVKTRLAADKIGTLTQIKVDTDMDGVVWLSGTSRTQEAAERAVEIARRTDGVVAVKSDIVVAPASR